MDRIKAAPEQIVTTRLLLRRPRPNDIESIFHRYASNHEVSKYLSWARHETLEDTKSFLLFSDAEWQEKKVGPYLIELRDEGEEKDRGDNDEEKVDRNLIGSTGLALEGRMEASTGYVLAVDAWSKGYATEVLRAMIDLAEDIGIRYLKASCHVDNVASQRVLEKFNFIRLTDVLTDVEFPNLIHKDGQRLGKGCVNREFCYRLDIVDNKN